MWNAESYGGKNKYNGESRGGNYIWRYGGKCVLAKVMEENTAFLTPLSFDPRHIDGVHWGCLLGNFGARHFAEKHMLMVEVENVWTVNKIVKLFFL